MEDEGRQDEGRQYEEAEHSVSERDEGRQDEEAEHSVSERDEDVDVNAGDDAEEKEKKVRSL
jgi:hypothetical protein